MSQLEQQLARMLPPRMTIPEPLRQLFSWIEARGQYVDHKDGRVGFLSPPAAPSVGTNISFHAEGNGDLRHWFGHDRPEVLNRLCVFANTGGDGSMAAFWLDEQVQQKIVHLGSGSGSGSTMVCVLGDDAVDFLRLLAIGYEGRAVLRAAEGQSRFGFRGCAEPRIPGVGAHEFRRRYSIEGIGRRCASR